LTSFASVTQAGVAEHSGEMGLCVNFVALAVFCHHTRCIEKGLLEVYPVERIV